MTINIQKATNVNVTGHHSNKNCKAVYNITTGEIYASGLDAANALEIDPSCVSAALTGKSKTCKGMRLCLVSKIMEHLEEITDMWLLCSPESQGCCNLPSQGKRQQHQD